MPTPFSSCPTSGSWTVSPGQRNGTAITRWQGQRQYIEAYPGIRGSNSQFGVREKYSGIHLHRARLRYTAREPADVTLGSHLDPFEYTGNYQASHLLVCIRISRWQWGGGTLAGQYTMLFCAQGERPGDNPNRGSVSLGATATLHRLSQQKPFPNSIHGRECVHSIYF